MKKCFIILSVLLLCTGLFAQESTTLEDLRLYAKTALLKGEQEARRAGTDSVVLGEILFDGYQTPLGRLLSDLLTAEITNASSLNLIMNPGILQEEGLTWLILEGVIHKVDEAVYMQLKIVDAATRSPRAIVEKTMDYNGLAELLAVESYDDYYYEETLVDNDYFMEPNNDSFNSVEYVPGDVYELALTRGDVDWFHFEVGEEEFTDDAVMVEIYTTGDTDTYMTVYGPDDPDLYYGESDDYLNSNAGMVLTMDEPGTYWVAVSGYSDETNGYYYLESRMDAVEFADEYEPNNTRERATPLSGNDEQDHAFASGDSLDVFAITIDSAREVVFYTESHMDTYMDLYDEYGNYIASDDDGGKDSNARLEIDLNRGTYYLEVRPYDEASYGSYRMIFLQE